MALMDDLKEQAEEEQRSYDKYVSLGQQADNAGLHMTAKALYKIAQDEIKHSDVLRGLYMRPELGPYPGEEQPVRTEETAEAPFDYNKAAEFIAQNVLTIVPEHVGERLAEAEATIDTWLKGEERSAALRRRADARA